MKRLNFLGCLMLGLICLMALGSGCRRKPSALTYIPGQTPKIANETIKSRDDTGLTAGKNVKPNEANLSNANANPNANIDPNKTGGYPLPDRNKRENMKEDREYFKANTVYFEFDRSTIKASERGKIEAVAKSLKTRAEASVEVEGHCDERGTEEYNRSLGERRALSVREYLINLGISSERVFTVTFGEDKPAVEGHNEAAWSKNRRSDFILLTPKN